MRNDSLFCWRKKKGKEKNRFRFYEKRFGRNLDSGEIRKIHRLAVKTEERRASSQKRERIRQRKK